MTSPLLELDSVTKRFGRVVIAEDLSLAIGAGDTVGIVGPNGAGKTSLFGLISGDLPPTGARSASAGARSPGWTRRPGAGSASAARTRCRGRSPT